MRNKLIWISLLFLLFPIILIYAQSNQDSFVEDLMINKNNNLQIIISESRDNLSKSSSYFFIEEYPFHGFLTTLTSNDDGGYKFKQNVNYPLNSTTITKDGHRAITYIPNVNYTGPDSFTFKTTDSQKTNKVFITINPPNSKLIFNATSDKRVALAFGLSLVIVFLIFLIAYFIITRVRIQQRFKPRFWDIIRDDNWFPNLARFQFLLWTGIVLFAYLGVALSRLFTGVEVFIDIPHTLLIVMGISASVPVAGAVIQAFKYRGTNSTNAAGLMTAPTDRLRKRLPGFKTMLMENNRISLPRFQMFAWTWIGIIAYLGLIFWEVDKKLGYLEDLTLPGLPIVFVSLMGLSQGAYLIATSVEPSFPSVSEVRPGRIRLQNENNLITIIGSNFGANQGTVWIESFPPISEEEKILYFLPLKKSQIKLNKENIENEIEWQNDFFFLSQRREEQFDVTPKTHREDNRIVVSLDSIKNKLKPQKYVVRVEKKGLFTLPTISATFEITFPIVIEMEPSNNSKNVPIDSTIKARFNQIMRISTITTSTFVLCDSHNHKIDGIVDSDGITATFKPIDNLSHKTFYTATITIGVTDEEGGQMPFEKTWSFRTKEFIP